MSARVFKEDHGVGGHCGAPRVIEGGPGFPGAPRAMGGVGGHVGAPHLT